MTTLQRIACCILSLLVSSCVLTGSEAPPRTVRVKAVADPKLRDDNPQWREEVRGLVEAASDYFEREFGIRFLTVETSPWPLEERTVFTRELLTKLQDKFPLKDRDGGYDLMVGFARDRVNVYFGRARVDRIGDCRQGLGNYLVSSVPKRFRYRRISAELEPEVVALIHELGHIFGAEHSHDTNSIMHEDFGYRTEFDEKNRGIILKNKLCPFGK